jgi:Animal haem peroxidase/TAT (twin-arginine translocation) pathway signal sequence
MEPEERTPESEERIESVDSEKKSDRPSRRQFLKGVGVAGAGLVAGSLGAESAVAHPKKYRPPRHHGHHGHVGGGGSTYKLPPGAPQSPTEFGRIFPKLKPFAEPTNKVLTALREVGKPGGIMDAKDNLAAGGKALIVDPTVNGNPPAGSTEYGTNPDNLTMTAGSTFVGQFTDHDVTFDQTSQLGVPQDPLTSKNTRTPAVDLDTVFGGGPGVRPDLFVPNADGTVGPKMKIGALPMLPGGSPHEDLPRVGNGDNTAVIGDPRNDENLMLGGLHSATILFYNRVLDELQEHDMSAFPAAKAGDLRHRNVAYLLASQITRWHTQWLLVEEHLRQVCGDDVVNDVLIHGNRFYLPPRGDAYMPIEFSGACYRFGHSMVRPSYRANFTKGTGDSTDPAKAPFFGEVFDPAEPNFDQPADTGDLRGGFPAPKRYIGWQTFFDFGDLQVKPNKKIDTKISTVLFRLPLPAIAPHTQTAPVVLPQRNLERHVTWNLPSGQDVAKAMGVTPLSKTELSDIEGVYKPFGTSTPLWFYVLAEAKAAAGGLHLGPVGGRIVAETLIGLLRGDPSSYLSVAPGFQPFLGTDMKMGPNPLPTITGNREYTRAHFLYHARVVQPGIYR